MGDEELIAMARLAQRDERMSTGALYGDLADRIEALTAERAKVARLEASLLKAEQDFYEAANRFQDEDYEGPHEKFTVNVVCHIKPYFDMNMKHLRDSAAAARAALNDGGKDG